VGGSSVISEQVGKTKTSKTLGKGKEKVVKESEEEYEMESREGGASGDSEGDDA